jgi:hypothetical protein
MFTSSSKPRCRLSVLLAVVATATALLIVGCDEQSEATSSPTAPGAQTAAVDVSSGTQPPAAVRSKTADIRVASLADAEGSGNGDLLREIDAAGMTVIETAVKLFHEGGFLAETMIGNLNPLTPQELDQIGREFHSAQVKELPIVSEGPHVERALRLLKIAVQGTQWTEGWMLTVIEVEGPVAFTHAGGFVYVGTDLMDNMTDEELLWVLGHEVGHVELKHTDRIWSYITPLYDYTGENFASFATALITNHLRVG